MTDQYTDTWPWESEDPFLDSAAASPDVWSPARAAEAWKRVGVSLREHYERAEPTGDRAVVIIWAADLDVALRDLLAVTLQGDPKVVASLLDNELSHFGTRIKVAFCLGLIDQEEYHDLDVIRRIRNDFAHRNAGLSFDTPPVNDRCRSLKMLANNVPQQDLSVTEWTPLHLFQATASILGSILHGRAIDPDFWKSDA